MGVQWFVVGACCVVFLKLTKQLHPVNRARARARARAHAKTEQIATTNARAVVVVVVVVVGERTIGTNERTIGTQNTDSCQSLHVCAC